MRKERCQFGGGEGVKIALSNYKRSWGGLTFFRTLVLDKYMVFYQYGFVDGEPNLKTVISVNFGIRHGGEKKERDFGVTYVGERFLTPIVVTDMRLLASMRARVYSQGAALNEALVAILDITMIGSLIGMYAVMATEI